MKRLFSILMIMLMLFGMVPSIAFATPEESTSNFVWEEEIFELISLPVGKYILSIVSDDGSADAEFTISATETKTDTTDNTKAGTKKHGKGGIDTGDTNNVLLYAVLGLTALLGSILVLIARRKVK